MDRDQEEAGEGFLKVFWKDSHTKIHCRKGHTMSEILILQLWLYEENSV